MTRRLIFVILVCCTVFVNCIHSSKDYCDDEITWQMEDGQPSDLVYIYTAMIWWSHAGYRFADKPSDSADLRFHFLPGYFKNEAYVSGRAVDTANPAIGMYYVSLYIDPEKTQGDFFTTTAVAAHEMGHALGFKHIPTPANGGVDSIMNTYRRFSEFRDITDFDKKRAKEHCGW